MTEITTKLILLFLLMAAGFIVKKAGLLDKTGADKISSFISNVTMPVLYIATFQQRFTPEKAAQGFSMLGFSLIFYAIAFVAGIIFVRLTRAPAEQRGVLRFLIFFSNAAFMGYPVLSAILGKDAIFYGVFFNLLFNVLAFTFGVYLIKNGEGGRGFDKKVLLSPGIMGAVIGLALFLLSPFVPEPVYAVAYDGVVHDALQLLGDTTIPLSMVVIGTVLADIKQKEALTAWRVYLVAAMRLIIIPAAMLAVMLLFGGGLMTTGVPVIISGMPSAVFCVILAKEYGGDEKLASVGVFFTTLLSAGTMPLLAAVLQRFAG